MGSITLATAIAIILRTTIIYFVILILLRLAGKREIGQLEVFDLVVILLIANGVQNAMVGEDTSLIGGLVAAVTMILVNYAVSMLRMRVPAIRKLIQGQPTTLIQNGRKLPSNMDKEEIDDDMLSAAMRKNGVNAVEDVELATLEIDGSISIVPKRRHSPIVHRPRRFFRR